MALRPLTLQELSTAIGIVPTSAGITMDQTIRDRIAHCGPFLKVQGQTVHLVHQSARDYLLRKNCDINTVLEGFRIKSEAAHLELARTCFDCVTQSCLQDTPLIGVVNIDQTYLRESVLLKYAIIYWPEHARCSSTLAGELFSVSMPFFRKKSKLRENWWLTYFYSRNNFHHYSPPLLHIACYLGIVPWVEVILDKSRTPRLLKPIDKKDIEKRTPLRGAAEAGQEAVVRLLLSRGADTNIEDNDGWTALCYAAMGGHETIVRLLVDHGADINIGDNHGQTALFCAVLRGHDTTVRPLLDHGADINIGDISGRTTLCCAALGGNETIVPLLVDHGADTNIRDNIGRRALYYAALGGHETIVRLLIKYGADVNKSDIFGETALHIAAKKGYTGVVRLLVEHEADVNIQGKTSRTALHLAAVHKHKDIEQLLKGL
jgi:ankyrin repeat protein